MNFAFYDIATGRITGQGSAPPVTVVDEDGEERIEVRTECPEGCAVYLGAVDYWADRINPDTGEKERLPDIPVDPSDHTIRLGERIVFDVPAGTRATLDPGALKMTDDEKVVFEGNALGEYTIVFNHPDYCWIAVRVVVE